MLKGLVRGSMCIRAAPCAPAYCAREIPLFARRPLSDILERVFRQKAAQN